MPQGQKEYVQLKDLFSDQKLKELAIQLAFHHKSFNKKKFLEIFKTKKWKDAELKARVRIITNTLHDHLPENYEKSLSVLIPASKKINWGYFGIFFPDYVECYGLNSWTSSMKALKEFTKSSSGEFAIRPFIEQDQDRAFKELLKWSKDKNHHVRRLSSEGCRPRLPWGRKLKELVKDPSPILEILENLKDDPELYVRKSVANNINDISKDHPEIVLDIAKKWIGKSERTDWIIKHGLRTLLKKGNKRALKIFGHHETKGLEINSLKLSVKNLNIGDKLNFSFKVKNSNEKALNVRLEYAIYYVKKNGVHSKKVFQISKATILKGTHSFSKSQSFKNFTTRKHYPGKHKLGVLINGQEMAIVSFVLN